MLSTTLMSAEGLLRDTSSDWRPGERGNLRHDGHRTSNVDWLEEDDGMH